MTSNPSPSAEIRTLLSEFLNTFDRWEEADKGIESGEAFLTYSGGDFRRLFELRTLLREQLARPTDN